jgi:hypothetical protein
MYKRINSPVLLDLIELWFKCDRLCKNPYPPDLYNISNRWKITITFKKLKGVGGWSKSVYRELLLALLS